MPDQFTCSGLGYVVASPPVSCAKCAGARYITTYRYKFPGGPLLGVARRRCECVSEQPALTPTSGPVR